MRYAITTTALAAVLLSLTSIVAAQNQTLKFEVASIKPNTSGQQRIGAQFLPGGGLVAPNVTLWTLILIAYRVAPFQVGVPKGLEWVDPPSCNR